MTDERGTDAELLAELASQAVAIDVDRDRAAEILARARRGPSPLRFVEPILAAVLASSYLGWAIVKIVEALGG